MGVGGTSLLTPIPFSLGSVQLESGRGRMDDVGSAFVET